ncbi:MAG: Lrp/AsnC family transcriptional regulator [Thaumarchaeota archaeon]|nr:Lrp/AsnC family transcriptional regulator [Nitrososphaerota archaeon]
MLDATDVRIFCEMAFRDLSQGSFADRHVSPSVIGKKLKLDEKTVRVRIKKMENDGFIKYYQATPSLALFGLSIVRLCRFEAYNIATKYGVLDSVQRMPRVVEILDYLGPTVAVSIAGRSPESIQEIVHEIAGRFELSSLDLGDHAIREPQVRLDRLDWRILRGLRYDARISTKDVSKMLSITPRMTEYRITKLLESGALSIRAMLDAQKQEGLIFYELEMLVNPGEQPGAIRRIAEMHGDRAWSVQTNAGVLLVSLFAFNLGEPEEVAMASMKIEGVKHCSLFILKQSVEPRRPSWIDGFIEEKIGST